MATLGPRDRPLDGLLRGASPAGDLVARQTLDRLQATLFGRPRGPIQLGRYVIEERIGAGGSGVVYRAFDPKHDRKVAIKLLHADVASRHAAARDRLLREAMSLAQLSHDNVVRIYDVGTYDPQVLATGPDARLGHREVGEGDDEGERGVYIAMELLDGGDVAAWLAAQPRGWAEIRDVFVAAARGLAAAHARGLVHRDFKPANVSIDAQGHVRVLDFGLARSVAGGGSPDVSLRITDGARQRLEELARPIDATLTAPGTLLGTPAYMAPEQHERQPATARSDQYSLCLALYEAWYGRRPFVALSEPELRQAKRTGELLPPTPERGVPSHLFAVLERGLSPRAEDRYPSMEALIEALTQEPRSRGGARWWRWGLGAALGGAAVLAAWRWWPAADDCEAMAWRSTWTAERREALQHAAATREPYVAAALERLHPRLEAVAASGVELGAARCRDDGPRSAGSDCLERSAARFTQLVEAIASLDGATLLRADEGLDHWRGASVCRDAVDAPQRGAIAEALERARLAQIQGQLADALASAREAHAAATELGEPEPLVEAASLRGRLALAAGHDDEAERTLSEALWSSDASRPHEATALAALALLDLAREASPPRPDTALWIRAAREHAAMPELPAALRLRLYDALGRLALTRGESERARLDLEQGLALPTDPQADAIWRLRAARSLADAVEREGDRPRAEQLRAEARREATQALGEGHPALFAPSAP